jgi:HlyD family secretion protein
MKKKTVIIIAAALVVVVAGYLIFGRKSAGTGKIKVETTKVEKGTVSRSVTATGTLEAITTVEVGTQVSGIVQNIYVDFNSMVKKGQLLAKLDTTNLAASMEQTKAAVDNAKAELDFQEANYKRLSPLNGKNLISQSDFDQTVYNLNKARANYNSALAQHKRNRINLDYAFIHSPIDGIVLNRAVEEGQTVAASFNTPTLFTIANDLTQMRVEANVDEADIGQVKKGQRVEFTVDAYTDQKFSGEVTEVRLEPKVTNNVVTYTIIIAAPNPDFKLMPGMTAETNIFTTEKTEITVVPSKALRFTPDQKLLSSYMKNHAKSEMPVGGPERTGAAKPGNSPGMMPTPGNGSKTIWVMKDSMIIPVPVETGLDDDLKTEIVNGLKEGDEIVLDMSQESLATVKKAAARNPFMPGPPAGGRR